MRAAGWESEMELHRLDKDFSEEEINMQCGIWAMINLQD